MPACLSFSPMCVAGSSQSVPGARDPTNHEEEFARMISRLNTPDIESLWEASYRTRIRRGHSRFPDQEMAALALLIRNAREVENNLPDRVATQSDLAPRVQSANVPQPVIAKRSPRRKALPRSPSTPTSSDRATSSYSEALMTIAKAPPRPTGHDCVICRDPIFGAEVRAPCGHFYDISCITDLFKSATRDESLYPPRCCLQTIPLTRVRKHLTQSLLTEFELKAQEFGTMKRVYCAAPECSRFLGPLCEGLRFSKIYECTSPTCTTLTCGRCCTKYEEFHHRCTSDGETKKALAMGRTYGWSRCPGCTQMIELTVGCHHMTCRCKTEFCYICCARWKTCSCPTLRDAVVPRATRNQPLYPRRQNPAIFANIRPTTRRAGLWLLVPRQLYQYFMQHT